jgi:hypothetical protein
MAPKVADRIDAAPASGQPCILGWPRDSVMQPLLLEPLSKLCEPGRHPTIEAVRVIDGAGRGTG